MEFRLLGPLEVSDNGSPVPLGGPQQRAVLAHLLLRPNQVVAADRLIDEVWGEEPPPAVRSSLQSYVSRLRKTLGAQRLEGRAQGYVLHVDPSEVDASRFQSLLQQARQLATTDPADAVRHYAEALACWRGPALDDLAAEPSLQAEIARLEELRLAAVEERIDLELALGQHAELVPELETLVAQHPLREHLCAALMLALYRSGRQSDALAAFQRVRRMLADELGVDPSPELRRLEEQILRQDPGLEVAGVPLRGYRLLERVGEGSFGVVYRAVQPQVGRDVAVKVVHPQLANDPDFIRRFEAEAQLVARLEYPNIVPLYDYWREPDAAYLVMRYLRGGSLRDALVHGPLDGDGASRVVEQVGLALTLSHRQGVVHRDVRPENILFDDERNAYLSDFGIAKELAAVQRTSGGLAYYLSPEEARGEPPSPRADIYSLGLVVYEMLAGTHPWADTPPEGLQDRHLRDAVPALRTTRPELPEAVDEVIARATAKDPDARYADALDLAAALRTAFAPGHRPSVAVAETRNPYKGLRAFTETDALDFFGREALTARLLTRLREEHPHARFLAVVGPSGSGKSSVVRAGLVPALRAGALPDSESWFVVQMTPGAAPTAELDAALMHVAATAPSTRLADLDDPSGLLRAAREVLADTAGELLVIVDQFEELFTLTDDESERQRFIQFLYTAATDPGSRVRVVVTLRADFYDRPLTYPGLADLVRARTEAVVPLSAEELERSVAGPAERVGVAIGPGLVAHVVADVVDEPGALPLLQYALTELFDRRRNGTLSPESYRDIGGVTGALARRAEETYGALPAAGQEAARQLFLRLVTLGEGVEDTRRRVLRGELLSLDVDPAAMDAAIEAFGGARLLSFDRDPDSRRPTVEVAHEALLGAWARLRGWIDAAREDMRTERRLALAARDWADSDRNPSFLLSGARLEQLGAWRDHARLSLTPEERDLLEASLAEDERRRAEEQERRAREQALERRSFRRLRALVAVLTVAALVASGLTVFGFRQWQQTQQEHVRAETEARVASARELAAASTANLDVDPERSILLALAAVEATRAADGVVLPEAEEALRHAVKSSRVIATIPQGGYGLAVTSDGSRLAITGSDPADNTATVRDIETGEQILVLTGPDVGRTTVAFSPDDRLAATTHNDGTVRLWDAATGEELRVMRGHQGPPTQVTFSPDGTRIATGGTDETVRVWDVATGDEELRLVGHEWTTFSPAFSPDGSQLASASDDATARIWDLATGETTVLVEHIWPLLMVAFSPDGTRIATASADATARIWDASSGDEVTTLFHRTAVTSVAYSHDGTRIATGGSDGTTRVWDADTGRELMTLPGHTAEVVAIAFTPGGDRLLTSALDDSTRVWDISVAGSRDWVTVPAAELIISTVAFSPDGTRFAAPAEPSGVTIWDARTGEEISTLTGFEPKLSAVAFSPDGRKIAATSDLTFTPPVWDVVTGELLFTLVSHTDDTVRGIAFSPDGRQIVTGGWDETVRVWDAASGRQEHVIEPGHGPVIAVAFSPDGEHLVAGGEDGTVTVWDADSLEEVRILRGHSQGVAGVAFGPDGLLASAGWGGTAIIWDIDSGEQRSTLRAHDAPLSDIAVSPDGTRVATASEDATAKLWDVATGRHLLTLFAHDLIVTGVAFSPDGRLLATASPDGTVSLHLLPIDEFVELARERVTRDLTEDECRQFLARSC